MAKQRQVAKKSKSKRKKFTKPTSMEAAYKGNTDIDYDLKPDSGSVDQRSKKAVLSKQNATVEKTPVRRKSLGGTTTSSKKAQKSQKTKAAKNKIEEVSTKVAVNRMEIRAKQKRELHRKMAIYAISEKQCIQKSSMFRCIRSASHLIGASSGFKQVRFQQNALGMIHQSAEDYLTNIFYIADMISAGRGTETITLADFKLATAIARNELNINMDRKKKAELMGAISKKTGVQFTIFNPNEILQSVTSEELKNLKVPERFKLPEYLSAPEGARTRKSKKKAATKKEATQESAASSSENSASEDSDDSMVIDEGYTSDAV